MFSPGIALPGPNLAGEARPLMSRGGMGDPERTSGSDSACKAGVEPAGVPSARVASPKRASMSSRRTPRVSG